MNVTLSEVITLASFGNQYLKNGFIPNDALSHPLFQNCTYLDFSEMHGLYEHKVANDPLEWFEFLKQAGCKKIRLYQQGKSGSKLPPATLEVFADFLPWLLETIYENYSDYWVSANDIVYENQLNGGLWSSQYGKLISRGPITNLQPNPESIKANFKEILIQICNFAEKNKLTHWASLFYDAYQTLANDETAKKYDALIVRDNYEPINNQLMLAIGKADVFGGMGSWSDQGFSDDEAYERYLKLSDVLYQISNLAILAAVNHDHLENNLK